jgi:hypothetical protein
MENKTPAEIILDEIVQDGTGIEVTQDEALRFAKQIAELAFDAGWNYCDGVRSPLVGYESWQTPPPPNKEQFIKELFNTK